MVLPWSNPNIPGPSIVPAAKLSPMAGGQVRTLNKNKIILIESTHSYKPKYSQFCLVEIWLTGIQDSS